MIPRPTVHSAYAQVGIRHHPARRGTRLVFGVPGGGPNLDVVGANTAGRCWPGDQRLIFGLYGPGN